MRLVGAVAAVAVAVPLAAFALLAGGGPEQAPVPAPAQEPAAPAAAPAQAPAEPDAPAITVLASFYPVYELTREVGGDRADVSVLVPEGTEPHDWEPSIRDVQRMEAADAVVINGAGFETWAGDVASINPAAVLVDTSKGIRTMEGGGHGHAHGHDDEHGDERGDDHMDDDRMDDDHARDDHDDDRMDDDHARDDHDDERMDDDRGEFGTATTDPHIWLSPPLAQQQAQNIADGLAEADPAGAAYYQANADRVISELGALDSRIRAGLEGCRTDFISFHSAFSYFADEYGLTQHSVTGTIDPHVEPTPQRFRDVIETAEGLGIDVVFTEEGVDPRISGVIAEEIGGRTLVLSTLEVVPDGSTYVERMDGNLESLRSALCGP